MARRATYVRADTGVVEPLSHLDAPYERPVGVHDIICVNQPFGNERGQIRDVIVSKAGGSVPVAGLEQVEDLLRRLGSAEDPRDAGSMASACIGAVDAFVVPTVAFLAPPRIGAGSRVAGCVRTRGPQRIIRRRLGGASNSLPFIVHRTATNHGRIRWRNNFEIEVFILIPFA